MKRDVVAIVVVLLVALAAAVAVSVRTAHAESRFYPYMGLNLHAESGLAPRPWLEAGTAFSAGRIAPSVTGSLALDGQAAVAIDFRVRFKFGH